MEENQHHLDALKDIRQMMKQSNRFLSLSGLSGIFAGMYALAGAYAWNRLVTNYPGYSSTTYPQVDTGSYLIESGLLICCLVLFLSIATALILSGRRAKKTGQKLFDHTALRLVINLFIPLATGGIFCLSLLYHGDSRMLLVAPGMLIFYGLALVNGSKYTFNDLRYLGCLEILLGLAACFFPGYGLLFWAIGFGVLHILYGALMWHKYERK